MAKVLYDFNSDQSNELSIRAGDLVQIVSKEGNGKSHPPIILDGRSANVCRMVVVYEYHDIGPGLDARSLPGGASGSVTQACTAPAATSRTPRQPRTGD